MLCLAIGQDPDLILLTIWSSQLMIGRNDLVPDCLTSLWTNVIGSENCGSLLCPEWLITFLLEVCYVLKLVIVIFVALFWTAWDLFFFFFSATWYSSDVYRQSFITGSSFDDCNLCSAFVILSILLESRVDMWEDAFECFLVLHLSFLHLVHLNGDAMIFKMKMTWFISLF